MFELITALHLEADRATGRAHVPLASWLADHFPGTPLVPGTVLLELAAQIAGPLAETGADRGAVLGMVRSAVFRVAVGVPAEVEIGAAVTRREESSVVVRVEVRCGADIAVTAELVFAMVEVDEVAWAAREERVARWKAGW